jgi:hypothetical protein
MFLRQTGTLLPRYSVSQTIRPQQQLFFIFSSPKYSNIICLFQAEFNGSTICRRAETAVLQFQLFAPNQIHHSWLQLRYGS